MATLTSDRADNVTIVGSSKDVQKRLVKARAGTFLLLDLSKLDIFATTPTVSVETVVRNFEIFNETLAFEISRKQEGATLERLAENLVPSIEVTPRLLLEAKQLARAKSAVLSSGDFLTAAQVAEIAGLSMVNPSAQPSKWKRNGQIFVISHQGTDYFPGYGLDKDAQYRPLKGLAPVIEVLGEKRNGWGMAFWFSSANGFLGGKRPQDLIAQKPKLVLEAARDEVQEITHG